MKYSTVLLGLISAFVAIGCLGVPSPEKSDDLERLHGRLRRIEIRFDCCGLGCF